MMDGYPTLYNQSAEESIADTFLAVETPFAQFSKVL
jgi:hypothetical protein